mgnify:CR=1 FL=1
MNATEARLKLDKKGGVIDKQLTSILKKLSKAIEKQKDFIIENNIPEQSINWLIDEGYEVKLLKSYPLENTFIYKIIIP